MKKDVNKASVSSDDLIDRLVEIKDDIKTIGIRSTWLLGVLVLVTLGLANFSFTDSGIEGLGVIKRITTTLCLAYSILLLFYIPLLIMINFGKPIYGTRDDKTLKESIGENTILFNKLNRRFNSLIYLTIIPAIISLVATGFWYFNI